MRAYLYLALFAGLLAALTGSHWYAYNAGVSREQGRLEAKYKKAMVEAQAAAKAKEDALTLAYDKVANEYEQGKRDAQAAADQFVADLRSNELRLRKRWTCPRIVPPTEAGPSEPDAATADREESAGRIIGAAAECDRQVIGLQNIIKADRR